jgi:CubicO group peptidase (beta-lactamase class C family)
MDWEAQHGFSGVVLITHDGKSVVHKAYGLANREKNIPIRLDTIFGVGSTPIDFTKAGILLLAERGKLALSDPITKYFNDVPEDKQSITIQYLMTGRSGLLDFHDIPSDKDKDHSWIDRNEAVKRILSQKLLFAPGSKRQHSHSAWGLLAAILEIVSKQSYQDFTREHLFKPAGMVDTGFFGEPYSEQRMAIGYGPRKDGEINAPPYWGQTSWLVMGSGGQVSTTMDMWRWLQAIYGGKILSPQSIRLYAGPGQGMLIGGDVYGFQILYAGDNRSMMVLISNNGGPIRNAQLRKLGQALTTLVTGRQLPKFVLGIEMDVQGDGIVKILNVIPGGAAERHGLHRGDLILKIGGKSVGDEPSALLAPYLQTGNAIEFEIERDGKRQTLSVTPAPRSQ